MRDTYFSFLQELAEYLDLAPDELLATEELVCDGLSVAMTYAGDDEVGDLVFFADLGSAPPDRQASVYRVLLEANSLWVGTGGATVGVHPGSGNVLLCARLPLEATTAQGFALALDAFVDTAQFWQGYLCGNSPAQTAPLVALAA